MTLVEFDTLLSMRAVWLRSSRGQEVVDRIEINGDLIVKLPNPASLNVL